MVPTSQVLRYGDHWLQKAQCSMSRRAYGISKEIWEQMEGLREDRYGNQEGVWDQEQADGRKEVLVQCIWSLIEVLSEQDDEAAELYGMVKALHEAAETLYRESTCDMNHREYYRYLAVHIRQTADRLDLSASIFRETMCLVEQRPR